MATHKLDLASIALLDEGRVRDAFDRCVRSTVADMSDRPEDDRPRRVTLCLILKPSIDPDTLELRAVDIRAKVLAHTPPAESAKVIAEPRRSSDGRTLVFDDETEAEVPAP